jgi:hypothetical protein
VKQKLVLLLVLLLAIGCNGITQASPTPAPHKPSKQKQVDENDKPPFIGMTKAQALARYGKPKQKTSTDEGEQWTYVLNFGEFVGKHMIPFFFSTQGLRYGVLIFGADGRVKKFRWDTPDQ